ncbi:ferritin light chain-like [Meriones unguiculatus]|uniref:ferritin light chain-like n=1 Tax=Meriones unguiculatus TaxID=10047 RepID=UPI00293E331A|nr:ferritin light chain-like [Meriones unguiculatus]
MSARSRSRSQSHRNYPTEVGAIIGRLISMHLQASDTYLSLGFFFKGNTSVEGLVHFFRNLSEEKRQGAYLLMQSQQSSCDLYFTGQTLPSYQCDGSLDAMETSLALEKNLNQVLLDLHALGFANSDLQLCHFLETHFLEKEAKLIEKITDNLRNLRQQATEVDSLSEYLLKKLTFNGD